jgi:hypothetical protein
MSPRRAIAAAAAAGAVLLAVGCGGGGGDETQAPAPAATAPAAAVPVAVAPVSPGQPVRAGASTPAPVAKALAGDGVVVVAFLVPDAADDQSVAEALREVRSDPRAGSGVEYFVYTVGKDDFGDLADLLGVTGTPSVAVIGRDRVLVNMWTGLVDAEILRQSVSDARDRAAANPGAGDGAGASGGSATMTGSPAGIALARKVNIGAGDVPGVKVTGSLSVEGAGTMEIEAVARLKDGAVTGFSGSFALAGARFEAVGAGDAAHLRASSASCWARLPGGGFADSATQAPLVPADARVSAPRTEGGLRLIDVMQGGTTATYVIDGDGRVREVRTAQGTVTFEVLRSAPEIPAGTPVCDDPTDALEGLPAALGGTS